MPITKPAYLTQSVIEKQVNQALAEDLGGPAGIDITASLIPEDARAEARLIVREPAVLCGSEWFEQAFLALDSDIAIQWHFNDADTIVENDVICTIQGLARPILTAERTALNFLQTLSGTATTTGKYVAELETSRSEGGGTKILDTRKTIPNLRAAQKYAVLCGGGQNHRIGLHDAFLIKENHIATAGSIAKAIARARRTAPDVLLEIEVETLEQLAEALDSAPDVIMLDNFDLGDLKHAVSTNRQHPNRAKLEASGNLELADLATIAATGIDFISSGALTKHVKATDYSLRLTLLD